MPANDTPVDEPPLALGEECRHRFHKALAQRGPIPGENIDVAAPKALRTVVGIAIPRDIRSALPAREFFDSPLKSFSGIHSRDIITFYLKKCQQ